MNRKLALTLVVVLCAAVLLVFLLRGRSNDAESVTLKAAPLVRSVVVTGRAASESRVFLGATITARVAEMRLREGAPLKRGDTVVRLEDAEARAALTQAQAALRSAQARLASQRGLSGPVATQQQDQAEANAAAAQRELERNESLFRQGFIGQARLDEARRAAEVAQSQARAARVQADANTRGSEVESAMARVAEARAALELARSRLDLTRIVAPADGVLLSRLAEPGQIVQPGARLAEMSVSGPLQLVAQVDEKFLAQLTPGQAASVVADAFPERPFAARLRSLAPVVDAQRGSVEVKFALDAPPQWLRNDMTVSIEVVTARRENALAVPGEALRAGPAVLVIEDGRAVSRPVKTGVRTLTAVEIVEGLAAGAVVITDPAIAAGARVRAAPLRSKALGGAGAEGISRAMGN
ncbi:MAG: efflux RND transporter periplasmic adaptor subunit [Burkholderiales bacterium]|nr:efflux RND transporter periplasmic adaptor subunit [Burkholderiales bacterium]